MALGAVRRFGGLLGHGPTILMQQTTATLLVQTRGLQRDRGPGQGGTAKLLRHEKKEGPFHLPPRSLCRMAHRSDRKTGRLAPRDRSETSRGEPDNHTAKQKGMASRKE